MCNLPHFNKYRLGSGLGGGAVLLIWFSVILWQGIINNLAPKMHHHMDRVLSEHSPMWRQGVPFYCLGSPSSGKMSEVQQIRQEEGWRQKKKIEGKGIQTLFLEIVENPPQLHHMTFQKENATLLPPTPASSISFNTALFQSPTGQISQPRVVHHTHGHDPSHFRAFINVSEVNTRRLRHHQLQTYLPVNYSFLTVKNMTSPTSVSMWIGWGEKQTKQLSATQKC